MINVCGSENSLRQKQVHSRARASEGVNRNECGSRITPTNYPKAVGFQSYILSEVYHDILIICFLIIKVLQYTFQQNSVQESVSPIFEKNHSIFLIITQKTVLLLNFKTSVTF